MREATCSPAEEAARLRASISGLADGHPELSASTLLTRGQKRFGVVVGVYLVFGLITDAVATAIAVMTVVVTFYAAVVVDRIALFARSRRPGTVEEVGDAEALAVPDDALPVYTVLVPAYREPEIIATLLAHLDRLDYPRDRLDVKLLLEADDDATIDAVRASGAGDHVEVVLVPPSAPRTKPKALNYALTLARGEIVTIYDAEDEPEPLQLRRAAVALRRSPPEVACLQARLSFSNAGQNLITKWFTLEYLTWFAYLLPGLVDVGAPLPLGGTSNHFRRAVLDELGGWDPHNVTEDADLGLRLARAGYRCGVLDSVTLEEPNNDLINWVKQRSRWYKGYFQTALVHLRRPSRVRAELGWVGFAHVVLFVLGTPLLAALNPLFWLMTLLWFLGHPHVIKEVFPGPLFYTGTLVWVFGNFLVAYLTILTTRLSGRVELLWAAVLVPLYWVMMSMAAAKAAYQLIVTPTFWEKTTHGLHLPHHATAGGGGAPAAPPGVAPG
ncbi:MAG TPA: glycosyltransferase [Acidimicrobiales bacterium]|nr:glycosyltransferase [Acidimicrobiales bacterium]